MEVTDLSREEIKSIKEYLKPFRTQTKDSIRYEVYESQLIPFSLGIIIWYMMNELKHSHVNIIQLHFDFEFKGRLCACSLFVLKGSLTITVLNKHTKDIETKYIDTPINSLDDITNMINTTYIGKYPMSILRENFIDTNKEEGPNLVLKRIDLLVNSLPSLYDLIGHEFEMINDFSDILPLEVKDSGEKHHCVITFKHKRRGFPQDRLFSLISREIEIKNKVKTHLQNYNDLGDYVIIIRRVIVDYHISKEISIIINVYIEALKNEDYYDTIGALKSQLNYACQSNNHGELSKLAKRLNLSISEMNNEDVCDLLEKHINNLRWEDFST